MSQKSKGVETVWTDEMVNNLLFLKRDFRSSAEIATMMNYLHGTNLTRNAILGKLYRVKHKGGNDGKR